MCNGSSIVYIDALLRFQLNGPSECSCKVQCISKFLRARHLHQQLSPSLSLILFSRPRSSPLSPQHTLDYPRESRSSRKINFPCPDSLLLFFFLGGFSSYSVGAFKMVYSLRNKLKEKEREREIPAGRVLLRCTLVPYVIHYFNR